MNRVYKNKLRMFSAYFISLFTLRCLLFRIRRIYYCEKKYDKCVNFSQLLRDFELDKNINVSIAIGMDPDLGVCKMFGAYCSDYSNIYKRVSITCGLI